MIYLMNAQYVFRGCRHSYSGHNYSYRANDRSRHLWYRSIIEYHEFVLLVVGLNILRGLGGKENYEFNYINVK